MKALGTLLFGLIVSGFLPAEGNATVYSSNGSAADVQGIHNRKAVDGDTITIPPGTFTWSAEVNISKAIKLKGEGSGRIIGNTKTETTIGTGSKKFTTTRAIPGITAGETLRIAKMAGSADPRPGRENYMEGTVTSYSGNALVMNITSTGGGGTWKFWFIATKPQTTIINDYSNDGHQGRAMINVQQNPNGSTEFSGIAFVANPNNGNRSAFIGLTTKNWLGPKTLIHDCWFETDGGGLAAIYAETNQGLIWNCSFDDKSVLSAAALTIKFETDVALPSWRTNSTIGSADTNGATNFYIEDCDFHGFLNATDFDSNTRAVFRHNTLDNSGMGSHGADTSPFGMRHVEIYNNELIFDDFGADGNATVNVNWFFWQRGGTSVITDNILPAISSEAWGSKGNIFFSALNLRRSKGCYPCWQTYPAPHQIGQGYGPGAVFHKWSCTQISDASYYIYAEPVYIWNNTGSGGNKVGLNEETTDSCSGHNIALAQFVQSGRDYIIGPKPGYQKFTYPHPLRSSEPHIESKSRSKTNTTSSPKRYRQKNKKGWGQLEKKNEQKPNEALSQGESDH
jgi:hypothetical protein